MSDTMAWLDAFEAQQKRLAANSAAGATSFVLLTSRPPCTLQAVTVINCKLQGSSIPLHTLRRPLLMCFICICNDW